MKLAIPNIVITPTGEALGAIVTGLDIDQGVLPEVILQLKQALRDYHILIFKHQAITEVQLLKFATYFGDLFVPPAEIPVLGSQMSGSQPDGLPPAIVTIANAAPEYGSSQALLHNAELLPHSDHQWTPCPSSGSLLYALEVPDRGGDTQWVNLIRAYEELDEATKVEIADLQLITYNPFLQDVEGGYSTASYRFDPTLAQVFPHPLIRTHPDSGKKILYLNCSYEVAIANMEPKAGAALIDRLRKHISQPDFFYNHHWSVGDIVYWDNQCTLHYRPAFDKNAKRVMKRVSLAGSRPLLDAGRCTRKKDCTCKVGMKLFAPGQTILRKSMNE